jgi:hypothetical protein
VDEFKASVNPRTVTTLLSADLKRPQAKGSSEMP